MLRSIGIFGGTFDPVHTGHISLAQDLKNHLHLDEMYLLPCRLPPHRPQPSATDVDRLQMLQIAIKNTMLKVDDRELRREGPSYTIDTLLGVRNDYGNNCAIVLCMGMDAFASFNTWYHWDRIPDLAHIAVVTRADFTIRLNDDIARLLNQRETKVSDELTRQAAGKIYLTQLSQIPVSSTAIRQLLATNAQQTIPALDPDIQRFIQQKGLYHQ